MSHTTYTHEDLKREMSSLRALMGAKSFWTEGDTHGAFRGLWHVYLNTHEELPAHITRAFEVLVSEFEMRQSIIDLNPILE